nr:MAG TPA: hypothetical protein [Caudoviricetes sp.]
MDTLKINGVSLDTNTILHIDSIGDKYIRYSDGVQICWTTVVMDAQLTSSVAADNSPSYYCITPWTFPKPFCEHPSVQVTSMDLLLGLYTASAGANISNERCELVGWGKSAGNFECYALAIGKWKTNL